MLPLMAWGASGRSAERPSGDPTRLEAWCYTDRFSYRPGERVEVHVHSTASTYALTVIRDGADPEVVWSRSGLPGRAYETPPDAYAVGCRWPVGCVLEIDPAWPSGFLSPRDSSRAGRPDVGARALLRGARGPSGTGHPAHARADDQHAAQLQRLGWRQRLLGARRRSANRRRRIPSSGGTAADRPRHAAEAGGARRARAMGPHRLPSGSRGTRTTSGRATTATPCTTRPRSGQPTSGHSRSGRRARATGSTT